MNEEEIIKEIKSLSPSENAILCLLDLYQKEKLNSFNLTEQLEKEKEENSKLKTCDGILDVFSLGKESSRQRIKFDWVEKSKIREKIEELEKERKRKDEEDIINPFYDQIDITHIIVVLEELLKGE